jgi:CRISPR/Cas system-associated exonuclease Cas4 (RecB family)
MSQNAVLAALRDAEHTSCSSIKCYLRCPQQWAHRYRLRTQPSHRNVALLLGSALHEVAARFYEHFRQHAELPMLDLLQDVFNDCWCKGVTADAPIKADDLGAEKDIGIGLVQVFHDKVPRPLETLAVEHPFVLPAATLAPGSNSDLLVVGALDAVVIDQGGQVTIVELKTAARRWSTDQLVNDFQPTLYQIAARETGIAKAPQLRMDFVLKTKRPALESVSVLRTKEQEVEMGRVSSEVLRAIEQEIFYPVRSWACEDCEFGHACK